MFGFLNLIETAQFHADNRIKPAKEREMFNYMTQIVPEHVDSSKKPKFNRKADFWLRKFTIAKEFVEAIQMTLILLAKM